MKVWLVLGLLVVSVVWMRWSQAQLQHHVLGFLARAAKGDARRGATVTTVVQALAFVLAVALLGLGSWFEVAQGMVWARVALVVPVLVVYVPFAGTLAKVRLKKIRTPVEQRLEQQGAPPAVAAAIARAGRPWSLVGSMVMLAAVFLLAWHHGNVQP